VNRSEKEKIISLKVRFRTVGDMSCTAAIPSHAEKVSEIIEELSKTDQSERSSRVDDMRSDTAMEDRKRNGYF
jgi:sulfate adenylyltransferase subunit 2